MGYAFPQRMNRFYLNVHIRYAAIMSHGICYSWHLADRWNSEEDGVSHCGFFLLQYRRVDTQVSNQISRMDMQLVDIGSFEVQNMCQGINTSPQMVNNLVDVNNWGLGSKESQSANRLNFEWHGQIIHATERKSCNEMVSVRMTHQQWLILLHLF